MAGIRILKQKKGQAIVETAFILPIIILILTGIIDFGIMFNNYLVIANASREAARFAAVGYGDDDIENIVQNIAGTLDAAKIVTSVYPSESLRKKGEEVTVAVEYDNNLFTPVISAIIPNPVRLKARTVMRVE